MANVTADRRTYFILEEIFQILLESLDHDPFSQRKNNLSKKHLARLRELLGQEFSVWLAETGNLYFSTLKSAKNFAFELFENENPADKSKQIYQQLLNLSRHSISFGIHSEENINALIKLQLLTSSQINLKSEISHVVENAIKYLQTRMSKHY